MSNPNTDGPKRDVAYWEAHLDRVGASYTRAALAIGRQRLRLWCAQNQGLTLAELFACLDDVQSVLVQAGARQGVKRRPTSSVTPETDPARRSHLRVIK